MSNLALVLQNSLFYGLILSVLMSALFLTGGLLSPDVMLRGYPPDIKAKYGPVSPKGERIRKQMVLPLFGILFGTIGASIIHLAAASSETPTFAVLFINILIVTLTFNLADLLILDWLIFVTLRPKFTVLPGTEGLAGYKDYAFHFKAFLRGTVLCLLASLVIAGIAVAIFAIIR